MIEGWGNIEVPDCFVPSGPVDQNIESDPSMMKNDLWTDFDAQFVILVDSQSFLLICVTLILNLGPPWVCVCADCLTLFLICKTWISNWVISSWCLIVQIISLLFLICEICILSLCSLGVCVWFRRLFHGGVVPEIRWRTGLHGDEFHLFQLQHFRFLHFVRLELLRVRLVRPRKQMQTLRRRKLLQWRARHPHRGD